MRRFRQLRSLQARQPGLAPEWGARWVAVEPSLGGADDFLAFAYGA